MNKEQLFESILNEAQIEVFPQNGKLQARGVGEKVVSNKTHNKLSGLDTQETTMPLTKTQLDGTKAVIAYLKSKNKLNDISAQFDTDPRPDIAFNGAGDAIITPDGGKGHPYQIPAEELEPFYEAVKKEEKIEMFEAILQERNPLKNVVYLPVKTSPNEYCKRNNIDDKELFLNLCKDSWGEDLDPNDNTHLLSWLDSINEKYQKIQAEKYNIGV